MNRYHITLGALTTANGIVVSASSHGTINGKPIALEGDEIMCRSCKSTGYIVCIGPRIPGVWMGKQVALDGDLCVCKCKRTPKLLPNQSLRFQTVDVGAGNANAGSARSAGLGQEYLTEDSPDEQVRAVDAKTGEAIPELAYYIQAPDGSTYTGYTDAEGLCERVTTQQPEELTVWFGEDAEKKRKGA